LDAPGSDEHPLIAADSVDEFECFFDPAQFGTCRLISGDEAVFVGDKARSNEGAPVIDRPEIRVDVEVIFEGAKFFFSRLGMTQSAGVVDDGSGSDRPHVSEGPTFDGDLKRVFDGCDGRIRQLWMNVRAIVVRENDVSGGIEAAGKFPHG
jgi:hypothetical protein